MDNGACPPPQRAGPCAIVIFGASGDLTKRKLLPSLYNLAAHRHVAGGVLHHRRGTPGGLPHETFREQMTEAMKRVRHAKDRRGTLEEISRRGCITAKATLTTRPPISASVVCLRMRKKARHAGQRAFLPSRSQPTLLRADSPVQLKAHGLVEEKENALAPRDHREAVWARPRLFAGTQP